MNTTSMQFIATSAFGIEKILKNEIQRLGYQIVNTENGSVSFIAPLNAVANLNLNLRCADRVYLEVGTFKALSFEDLFQGIKAIPWEIYLQVDSQFPVNAKSVKSKLFSLSDIQSISKKAIVDKLTAHYQESWFKETGSEVSIHVHLLNDQVKVLLDTSGEALHRRGYRAKGNEAPLKETLAAALVLLSNWYGDSTLIDPMCGTGTILIEAALLKRNIAPGLGRSFASEKWSFISEEVYKEARIEAYKAINNEVELDLVGYDIHSKTIEIAKQNAELAGVDDCIRFMQQDIRNWSPTGEYVRVITNPPYGERLEDSEKAYHLYTILSNQINLMTNWSAFILTSHEKFEEAFGKPADKNRKIYNGKIKCYYYQYLGPRKPKIERNETK